MAHVQKSTKAAVGHLIDHYGRDPEKERYKYLFRENKNIDPSRTHLNYNLAPNHDQLDFIHSRLQEVKCLNRKNVNVMCTWVVTVPNDLPKVLHLAFFKETYKFLESRYKKENVISAFVHMDEKTPHIHFAFIPVVHDKKKGIYKVSAKECISKTELSLFHPALKKHLENALGRTVNVLNGVTANGSKTVEELKSETLKKQNTALHQHNIQLSVNNLRLEEKIEESEKTCEQVKERYDYYQKAFEKKTLVLKNIENLSKNSKEELIKSEEELMNTKEKINFLKQQENKLSGKIDTLNNQILILDNQVKEKNDLLNKLTTMIRDIIERIFRRFWEQAKNSVILSMQVPPQIQKAESILYTAIKEADRNIEISLPLPAQEPTKEAIKVANNDIQNIINRRKQHKL